MLNILPRKFFVLFVLFHVPLKEYFVFRNSETLLHLLKGSLGTGILAMPNAFYHAGWILGMVGTIVIGLLCLYCIHLLIDAEHELCRRKKKPSMTYPETAQEALSIGPPFLQRFANWMP